MLRLILVLFAIGFAFSAGAENIIELDGHKYILSGDQLIDIDAFEEKPSFKKGALPVRGASYGRLRKWTDGVLPIEFEDNVPSWLRTQFLRACEIWAQYGQIKCQVGPYKNRTLRVSINSKGCWSTLGMNSMVVVARRLNLEPNGCEVMPVILHEIGHSLGLIHEHQRTDRDEYIEIVKENMVPSLRIKFNFNIANSRLHTPYDFFSIMHYGSNFFSEDGRSKTIVAKDPYKNFQKHIGRSKYLSPLDQYAIGELYGRTGKTPTLQEALASVAH